MSYDEQVCDHPLNFAIFESSPHEVSSFQKKMKYKDMRAILLNLGKNLLKSNPDLKPWIVDQRNKNNGLICPLEEVRSAEPINGYRNKCEFTIGRNVITKQPTIGFRMGRYNQGSVDVGSPDELLHVPQRMKDVVKVRNMAYPPRRLSKRLFKKQFQENVLF